MYIYEGAESQILLKKILQSWALTPNLARDPLTGILRNLGGHVTDQCCLLFRSSRAGVWNFSLSRYSVRVAVKFSRQKPSSNACSGGGGFSFFPPRSVWLPVVARHLAVFPFTFFITWKWWAPTPGLLSIEGWCLVNSYSVRDYIVIPLSSKQFSHPTDSKCNQGGNAHVACPYWVH